VNAVLFRQNGRKNKDNEQEIVDIMMTLFDDEQILKAYAKDIEDNTAKKTEKKTARETAKRMIKMGKLSLEEIRLCVRHYLLTN